MRRASLLCAALLAAGCFGGESQPDPPEKIRRAVSVVVAYAPQRTDPESLKDLLPGARWVPTRRVMEPIDLRAIIGASAPEIVILLDGAPRFTLFVGGQRIMTDAPYADLNGDGLSDTAVTRISGAHQDVRRQLAGRAKAPTRAAVLTPIDPRVHVEALSVAERLGDVGYTVSFRTTAEDDVVVRPGSAMPLAILDGGAIAGLTCAHPLGWQIPARFANEMFEHLIAAHRDTPRASIHRLLADARARYVRAHPGLAAKLRGLARRGRADADPHLLATTAWGGFGDPHAALPPVGEAVPIVRAAALLDRSAMLGRWTTEFEIFDDEETPVLSLRFETLANYRATARLIVTQNGEELYRLDAGAETNYRSPEPVCLGGHLDGTRYRGHFLLPLRRRTQNKLRITMEGDTLSAAILLLPGSAVQAWKYTFERESGTKLLARAPDKGGLTRTAPPPGDPPEIVRGTITLSQHKDSAYHLVNLDAVANRPPDQLRVGEGSFVGWFEGDLVEHRGVPFRIGRKVLVSSNDTDNVFELDGFDLPAKRIHLLVWGYGYPSAHVPLVVRFDDRSTRTLSLPLQEWTQAIPAPAFDFKNSAGYAHASIYHEILDVRRYLEIKKIESHTGAFGVVAVTLED